jgi:Kef-type K+ transport system membrane component KefB
MYLILIAWIYVALMMALAEATSPQGSWLGALLTLFLYGLLPMAILGYILGSPARRRARKQAASSAQADEHP